MGLVPVNRSKVIRLGMLFALVTSPGCEAMPETKKVRDCSDLVARVDEEMGPQGTAQDYGQAVLQRMERGWLDDVEAPVEGQMRSAWLTSCLLSRHPDVDSVRVAENGRVVTYRLVSSGAWLNLLVGRRRD